MKFIVLITYLFFGPLLSTWTRRKRHQPKENFSGAQPYYDEWAGVTTGITMGVLYAGLLHLTNATFFKVTLMTTALSSIPSLLYVIGMTLIILYKTSHKEMKV